MGRPKKFDHQTVLLSVQNCFWNHGVHRTSISSLVSQMEIQRSSFYNSFSSREIILGLVLEHYVDQTPMAALSNVSGSAHSLDQLSSFFADYCHFLAGAAENRGCLFLNGINELNPDDGQSFEIFHDYYLKLIEKLNHLWQNLVDDSNVTITNQDDAIQQMIVALFGVNQYSKQDANPQRLIQLMALSLQGLCPELAKNIQSKRYSDQSNGNGHEGGLREQENDRPALSSSEQRDKGNQAIA